MMKKVFSIILTSVMVLSAATYGADHISAQNISASSQSKSSEKTLIVYYSPSNSDTVDAMTSATPRVEDTPLVEYLAQTIGNNIDADIAKIIPETAYPLDYDETADRAKSEQDNDERPAFSLDINPEEYDTVFIGYPIWWYELPMVMETFFDTYDFSEKTIIPFNAHLGSGNGGTYTDIAELEPNATVLDGIAFSIDDAEDIETDIPEWLSGLAY